jgi:histone-lysine N-methyltransferase SETD3
MSEKTDAHESKALVPTKTSEAYSELDQKAIAEQKVITDRLIEWMLENGAVMPNLYFEYYAVDFRGVCIDTDFADDEIMVSIPPALLVTVEKAKASPIGQKISKSGCRLRSHAYVACMLLEEKLNPNSYWKPYLDVLPASYRCIPTEFTEEELEYLRGSLTLEEIRERQENYSSEYADLCKKVPEFAVHSERDYFWGRLVVLTRIFGVTIESTDTSALVPMADMLNHKYPAETYWTFDQGLNAFTITSQKDFVAGEQVYDSYGRKCNTEFFMNYGFVPFEDNPNNECKLILSFPEDSDMYTYKILLLPSDLHQVQVSRDYETEECNEMWSFLRLGFCTAAEFFQLTGGGYEVDDPKDISPRNLRNELEVLRQLSLAAQQSLSEFDCSVEDDRMMVQNAEALGLNRNMVNAIRTRASEKEVLQWYIDLCGYFLDLLVNDMTGTQFSSIIDTDPVIVGDENIKHYAENVLLPLLDDERSVSQLCTAFEEMKVSDYRNPRYTAFVDGEDDDQDPE